MESKAMRAARGVFDDVAKYRLLALYMSNTKTRIDQELETPGKQS
jgi:hypothetical protein